MARLLSLFIIMAFIAFSPSATLHAAESSFPCSVSQGFNFEKDSHYTVGFINSIKIGELELKSDLVVTDPEEIANTYKVFGVLSNIYWEGGYAEPLLISSQISTENKNMLAVLIHKSMENTEVSISFTVYSYDPKVKKYFKSFHSDGRHLKGLVHKSGGELDMALDADQGMEVVSPKNYTFIIGIMPQGESQQIHLAVSASDKFVKQWGVSISR